eukprot:m.44383 g.44383  ORF g.44383 m.44383 type:complete len:422 (-) comp19664_c0_seq4:434-1699(-)
MMRTIMLMAIVLMALTPLRTAAIDDSSGSGADEPEYECDGSPDSVFEARELLAQTKQDAERWLVIARTNLNIAREAAVALASMNQSASSYGVMVSEADEKLAQAEGSFVTRQSKERLEVQAAKRLECELEASECAASNDIKIDCIPLNWAVERDCASVGCGLSAKVETRGFSTEPFCGGEKCGASVKVSECPALPRCDFNATFSARQTLVLGGVSLTPRERITEDLIHDLRTVLRVYYHELIGHNGFRLDFDGVPSFGEPPVLIKDGRRRREGVTALDTYFDVEIVYEVQVDPTQNPEQALSQILTADADAAALLTLFTASRFFTPFVTDSLKLSVVVEGERCVVAPCSDTTCELVSNGCSNKVPCGDCGLDSDCAINLYACINDGDCSRMRESTDVEGTMDDCLLDTSQLHHFSYFTDAT